MRVRPSGISRSFNSCGLALLVFGLLLACYWPALRGGILWDDPAHITRPELRSWSGLGRIWTDVRATQQYYPVLFSAFWIEHRLWGDSTFGYHLLNVVLHATSCCLLALGLRRLWSTQSLPVQPGAIAERVVPAGAEWFAAVLFAAHPVCVESVAWITEQKNTLSLVFYLLAGLAYLEFAAHRRLRWYVTASALFLLALGSKSITVTLPAALLVVFWWKNAKLSWRREIGPLIPWFLTAAAMGLFTSWVERKVIGAEGAEFELSIVQRTLLAGRAVWFYVGKLVWPTRLNFFYPRWEIPADAAIWLAYLAAGLAVTAVLWAIRRRTRGALAGWLIYVGSLVPILGFFKVFFFRFSYVNDHFQYLASLGFIATAAGGAAVALERAPPWGRAAGRALCVVAVIGLAVLANRQSRLYHDNETLFRATIAENPGSWMAHNILAVTLSKAPDRHAEAIAEYEEALRLHPDSPDAHFGLGVELVRLPGRRAEAIAQYERALQLRPGYAEAHNNLGLELSKDPGRASEAMEHYEAALRVKPDFAEAHGNLANLLAGMPGRLPEAMAHYQEALRINPDIAWVHCRLAFCMSQIPGHESEALAQYGEALRIQPDYIDAHNAL